MINEKQNTNNNEHSLESRLKKLKEEIQTKSDEELYVARGEAKFDVYFATKYRSRHLKILPIVSTALKALALGVGPTIGLIGTGMYLYDSGYATAGGDLVKLGSIYGFVGIPMAIGCIQNAYESRKIAQADINFSHRELEIVDAETDSRFPHDTPQQKEEKTSRIYRQVTGTYI
jgi:hypothetical protein